MQSEKPNINELQAKSIEELFTSIIFRAKQIETILSCCKFPLSTDDQAVRAYIYVLKTASLVFSTELTY